MEYRSAYGASVIRLSDGALIPQDPENMDLWEFASSFERDHPVLVAKAAQIGLTDADIDALFIDASATNEQRRSFL